MHCSNCGKQIPLDSQFCQFCGKKIEENILLSSNSSLNEANRNAFDDDKQVDREMAFVNPKDKVHLQEETQRESKHVHIDENDAIDEDGKKVAPKQAGDRGNSITKKTKNKRVFPFVLCLILVCCVVYFMIPKNQEEKMDVSEIAKDVLYLEVYDSFGECLGSGSGFLVEYKKGDLVLVTNYHVIEDANEIIAYNSEGEYCSEIFTILNYDKVKDLALLEYEETLNIGHFDLADSDLVKQGDIVYAAGYPLGIAHTLSDGIISSRYIDEGGVDVLQITAPISSGSSGGVLLNEEGKVIGVTSAYYEEGQNINVAISSNEIKSLLDMPKSEVGLDELFNLFQEPIINNMEQIPNSETSDREENLENTNKDINEPINDKKVEPEAVRMNRWYSIASVGEEIKLEATVFPENATTSIQWSSTDPIGVPVDENGVVKIVDGSTGAILIIAETENGLTGECLILIHNEPPIHYSGSHYTYDRFPSVLSFENVLKQENAMAYCFEMYMESTDSYDYIYQTPVAGNASACIENYVNYLMRNNYVQLEDIPEMFDYMLIDSTGTYVVALYLTQTSWTEAVGVEVHKLD